MASDWPFLSLSRFGNFWFTKKSALKNAALKAGVLEMAR
jgi:hypothetical protein